MRLAGVAVLERGEHPCGGVADVQPSDAVDEAVGLGDRSENAVDKEGLRVVDKLMVQALQSLPALPAVDPAAHPARPRYFSMFS